MEIYSKIIGKHPEHFKFKVVERYKKPCLEIRYGKMVVMHVHDTVHDYTEMFRNLTNVAINFLGLNIIAHRRTKGFGLYTFIWSTDVFIIKVGYKNNSELHYLYGLIGRLSPILPLIFRKAIPEIKSEINKITKGEGKVPRFSDRINQLVEEFPTLRADEEITVDATEQAPPVQARAIQWTNVTPSRPETNITPTLSETNLPTVDGTLEIEDSSVPDEEEEQRLPRLVNTGVGWQNISLTDEEFNILRETGNLTNVTIRRDASGDSIASIEEDDND
jgi:hypothetical protein